MILKLEDTEIYYEKSGEGKTLIFLHGNGENSSIFKEHIAFFSTSHQVITIDTRAHGKSGRGTKELNFYTFAEDVIALMDYLDIKSAGFVGFSDGGNTALHIALIAPERVSSLVLCGANIFPKGMRNYDYTLIFLQSGLLKFLSLFSSKKKKEKEVFDLMLKYPDLNFDQISVIKCPTLVIVGENDLIKRSHTEKISGSIRNSTLRIIPDSDHFVILEKAEIVNNIIQSFLQ